MRLPHAEYVIVPEAKIVRYLLNPVHPVGGSKAIFFLRHGFNTRRWQVLAQALRLQACENDVAHSEETEYGTRFIVDGLLLAPNGSRLNVRSAWFMEGDSTAPRFITAHPLPRL